MFACSLPFDSHPVLYHTLARVGAAIGSGDACIVAELGRLVRGSAELCFAKVSRDAF